jgi:outer membrane biosynthesis protein TonB
VSTKIEVPLENDLDIIHVNCMSHFVFQTRDEKNNILFYVCPHCSVVIMVGEIHPEAEQPEEQEQEQPEQGEQPEEQEQGEQPEEQEQPQEAQEEQPQEKHKKRRRVVSRNSDE